MKRYSFVSGHKADDASHLTLEIDRRALPQDMQLGLWLDDDGQALPGRGQGPLVTVRSAGVRLQDLVLERGEVGVRVESAIAVATSPVFSRKYTVAAPTSGRARPLIDIAASVVPPSR